MIVTERTNTKVEKGWDVRKSTNNGTLFRSVIISDACFEVVNPFVLANDVVSFNTFDDAIDYIKQL